MGAPMERQYLEHTDMSGAMVVPVCKAVNAAIHAEANQYEPLRQEYRQQLLLPEEYVASLIVW